VQDCDLYVKILRLLEFLDKSGTSERTRPTPAQRGPVCGICEPFKNYLFLYS